MSTPAVLCSFGRVTRHHASAFAAARSRVAPAPTRSWTARHSFRSFSSSIPTWLAASPSSSGPTPPRSSSSSPSSSSSSSASSSSSSSPPPPPPSGSNTGLYLGLGAAALTGAAAYIFFTQGDSKPVAVKVFAPSQADYQKVYDEIARRLAEQDEYDDGSYGPVLVRLAWHASGTYDKDTNTGGSNGATMRFEPEGDHGANAGLKHARDFLEPVKQQFPWISYSDLWILAGITAFQEMQGPIIPWRPGRQDRDVAFCTPDGRLPDGSKRQQHLRDIFYRMGFDDREIVALSGAHALGRCHTDRSGFDGPWTFSPTVLTNEYYRLLLDDKWHWRKWNGPKQYQDPTKSLMMLPTDMALIEDKAMKAHVERYARDNDVFFKEFRDVIVKLFELGVPFESKPEDRYEFKPSE